MSDSLVRVEAAERRFDGRRVLGPVDLELRQGETVAVVGPNGAGKTTLMRLVAGLLPVSDGRIWWRDRPFTELGRRQLARRIAYVPQVRPTRVPLTVEQMVLLGRHPHLERWRFGPTDRDLEAVERALDLAGLAPLAGRPLGTLSGGERQAVYIAAALAQEAPLLILDEPTTHLDPAHQMQVAELIVRTGREGGRTVLTATHDLQLASQVSHRLVALKDGRVAAAGSPAQVLTAGLLGELFETPFEIVRSGSRPLPLMSYAGAGLPPEGEDSP